jgi:hypothetical protein
MMKNEMMNHNLKKTFAIGATVLSPRRSGCEPHRGTPSDLHEQILVASNDLHDHPACLTWRKEQVYHVVENVPGHFCLQMAFPPANGVGPMFSGNFAYTSDSRFPANYPLPIHDRYETAEEYDRLSR